MNIGTEVDTQPLGNIRLQVDTRIHVGNQVQRYIRFHMDTQPPRGYQAPRCTHQSLNNQKVTNSLAKCNEVISPKNTYLGN